MIQTFAPGLVLAACVACASSRSVQRDQSPPALLLGAFSDDYGNRYQITAKEWAQGTRARYHIVRWNVAGQYAIARNDADNPSDGGLFTRIDWLELPNMAPYRWGYCYSAYKASSAAVAETVSVAKRATPRTGCNGFPFSRMQPAAP